jgi:hypothetical protein
VWEHEPIEGACREIEGCLPMRRGA